MKDFKTIHSDRYFDVVEVDGQVGFKSKLMSVAVMPYTVDERGTVENLSVSYTWETSIRTKTAIA